MSTKLQQAIALIKSGDPQQGRQLLVELLQTEPRNEAAWLWMSNVVSSDEQRRHCLNQVLRINPDHSLAQKGLALLQQKGQSQQKIGQPVQPVQPSSRPPANLSVPSLERSSLSAEMRGSIPAPVVENPKPLPQASEHEPVAPPQPQVPALIQTEISIAEPLKRPKGLNLPALEISPELSPMPVPVLPDQPSPKIKRVWINPKAALKVVVLYDEAIAVASPSDKEFNRLQVTPSEDPPSPELLGSSLKLFHFKDINSIKAVPEADSLHISYTKGQNLALQRVPFASEETLHEFMQALRAKLGPRFEQTVKKYGAFEASIIPLIFLGIILFATYLFYGAAVESAAGVEPEIRGRRQLLKLVFAWLIMLLGPKGVLAVGILLTALVLFWLVARILNPPVRLILTPVQNRPLAQSRVEVAGPTLRAGPSDTLSPLEKTKSKPAGLSGAEPPLTSLPQEIPPSKHAADVAKPKKQGLWLLLVLSMVVVLIVCTVGGAGFLYMNLPAYNSANHPGLIEGGMIIDLRDQGLTSADLRSLAIHNYPQSNLVTVDLSRNQLDELPPEIGQFPHLKYLIARDNHLKTLPPEIGQLSDLEVLDLKGNHLLTLPLEIGRLKNLKELNLEGNPIRSIPPEITQKPDLVIHR